ncbi:MAG: site-specific integrase [Clostridia bacterium]|nr:site-specific integrase [Clostridia bacterium]
MKNEFDRHFEGSATFEEAAEGWLKIKSTETKESTAAQYRSIIQSIARSDAWRDKPLLYINEDLLAELGEEILQRYELRTAKLHILTINQVLKYAYDCGYIPKIMKMSPKTKPFKAVRPQVFSVSEQKTLTDYLLSDLDLNKLGVLICLYSGLRLGEICGLKWGDVDLKRQTIRIARTIQRVSNGNGSTYMLTGTPKSEYSDREVPIPSFLNVILQQHAASPECYVTTGTPVFTQPRTYQNIIKRYYTECEIPQYHFHTLRHTFASRAIELGFDPKSLSEILGHSSVKITLDLYVHPSMEAKKKEMERFSEFVRLS